MKYSLLAVFLLIGIAHGFFGSIGQAIDNIGGTINQVANETGNIAGQIDGAKTEVENVVGQILNIANGIQFAAKFLWDTVFSPAFDMLIQGRIYYLLNL
jgi:phage-related protein